MGKVLIVAERETVQKIFRQAQRSEGEVLFARSRSEILRALRSEEISAVIADQRVALTSGVDILKWIQKDHPWINFLLLAPEEEAPQGKSDYKVPPFVHCVPIPTDPEAAQHLLEPFVDGADPREEALCTHGTYFVDLSPEESDREIVHGIVEYIDQLPPLPLVVQRILQIIERDETSAEEIAEVLSLDTALAARVLRLVNSAMYALSNPVTTIQHAVALLGFSEVKNLTIGLKVLESFGQSDEEVMDRNRFWEHSLACALCARHLAQRVQNLEPEEVFLGGLLHDIGKLVFDGYFQDPWREVLDRLHKERRSPLTLEKDLLGVTHPLVGQWLARRWKIPEIHQTAILHHHRPPGDTPLESVKSAYSAMIYTANHLVKSVGLTIHRGEAAGRVPLSLLRALNLEDEGFLEETLRSILREILEWEKALGLFSHEGEGSSASLFSEGNAAEEKITVWVIGPPKGPCPSLGLLLRVGGYRVQETFWGERILPLVEGVPHDALIMDLRGIRVDPSKFLGFLKALRGRSASPILVVTSSDLSLTQSLQRQDIYVFEGPTTTLGEIQEWISMTRSASRKGAGSEADSP
jgi:putative nucleotidyltransferase with HDIG domain